RIAALFEAPSLREIVAALAADDSDFAAKAHKEIARNSPLSMACALEIIRRNKCEAGGIGTALELEYRFSHRAMSEGDFLEGVRAAVIDKDRAPRWQHGLEAPLDEAAARMLAPLGPETLTLESERNGL
ncbi:enoyl-CoA hydratase/isomerase family protein, partial [Roseovarius sp.]|uniref:enoyl-CoA hydratase/isomerase family protein n=1 Tax=Roseovarius sp. TaxID=1486281 RepID=UPI003567D0C2